MIVAPSRQQSFISVVMDDRGPVGLRFRSPQTEPSPTRETRRGWCGQTLGSCRQTVLQYISENHYRITVCTAQLLSKTIHCIH